MSLETAIMATLSVLVSVSLSVGAWFFRRLDASLSKLSTNVADMTTKVAVLHEKQNRWEDHEGRLRALESKAKSS